MLNSSVAFSAVTSIATIGLYLSYGAPVLIKLLNAKDFQPGPFSMGRFSTPVNILACCWVAFCTVRSPVHGPAALASTMQPVYDLDPRVGVRDGAPFLS
jgi:hypothetical protein